MLIRGLLIALIFTTTSCAAARVPAARFQRSNERWTVVQTPKMDEYLIFAKDQIELKDALASVGCKTEPCSVARIGDVYAVRSSPAR